MKNIILSDQTFDAVCGLLVATINHRASGLEFLQQLGKMHEDKVQQEIEELNRLDSLETEFRAAGGGQVQRGDLIQALANQVNNGGFKAPALRSILADLLQAVKLPDDEKAYILQTLAETTDPKRLRGMGGALAPHVDQ